MQYKRSLEHGVERAEEMLATVDYLLVQKEEVLAWNEQIKALEEALQVVQDFNEPPWDMQKQQIVEEKQKKFGSSQN